MSVNTRRRPSVVLVGRPNVGKSTLFNRIVGRRRAIVTNVPGTTRDVLKQEAEWCGITFSLVDTGGMFGASVDPLHDLVIRRGLDSLAVADVIVFLVDGREGLTPTDYDVATAIRTSGNSVVLAVNKMDVRRAHDQLLEFHRFGFGSVVEISAEHGEGIGELLDEVVEKIPNSGQLKGNAGNADLARGVEGGSTRLGEDKSSSFDRQLENAETRVAFVGHPNVGKSSLVNCLLREERVMVSDTPGTTRDAIDAVLRWHRRDFRIVDTAGIRRPGRVASGPKLETVSVLVAHRAMEHADVAVLVIDASEGVTDRDAAIAGEATEAGCSVIIAANKWDLVKNEDQEFVKTFDADVRRHLKFLSHAQILHLSAKTGERITKLIECVDRMAVARRYRVPTPELNRFLKVVTAAHPPRSVDRRDVRVLYGAQTQVGPPTFVIFTNVATRFHFSYERFLVNRLREEFGFEGTPIRLRVRRRETKR